MSVQTAWREMPFEHVNAVVRRGRKIKLTGILQAVDALEEVRSLRSAMDPTNPYKKRPIRAFLVRGESLSGEGLLAGDYVLVDETTDPPSSVLLLTKVGGAYVMRTRSELPRDAHYEMQIIGALVGIIRRRGFARTQSTLLQVETPVRPAAKLRILYGQLGMLEATCANTRNPRLQDALRNEADRVRRQLQFGAFHNKRC